MARSRRRVEGQALAHQVAGATDAGVGEGLDRLQPRMVDRRDALQRLAEATAHQQAVAGEHAKIRGTGEQVLQGVATVGVVYHQLYIQAQFFIPAAFPCQVQPRRIRPGMKVLQHYLYRHHRVLLQPNVL